jgi:hypothetical protein
VQANIPRLAPTDQSHELLRLRGEVGVLRRQLQELQTLADGRLSIGPQTNTAALPSSEGIERKTEDLRIEYKAEYDRARIIIEKLEGEARDAGVLERANILSQEDELLRSLLRHLPIAEGKLAAIEKARGPEDLQTEYIRDEVADLNSQIRRRSEGVLEGLNAKMGTLKASLDNMQTGVDSPTRKSQ